MVMYAFILLQLAARAYDECSYKKDLDKAVLNFSGDSEHIGQHVKEELFPLAGEDGVDVIGVQAGVRSTVRISKRPVFDARLRTRQGALVPL